MNISEEVRTQVFDEEWLDDLAEAEERAAKLTEPRKDVMAYIREHGMQYDEEDGRAVEMESWQKDLLDMLRTEAYYFAAQKMTKVMNEGWAAYWESLMMGDERFAGTDEFVTYADHQSRVLGSPGLNPYKLGKELWEYVENTTNRREVADKLLRVRGISWRNFRDVVDFDEVQRLLQPDPAIDVVTPETLDDLRSLAEADDDRVDTDAVIAALNGEIDVDAYPWKVLSYAGLTERHFSLVKPQNRGFLSRIRRSELEQLSRYMFDDERYDTVEEAIADVDYAAGWDRMREVRESHNDVTFLDEFLTQEFVTDNHYFTYEYTQTSGDYRVTSTEYEDVKKKLLLQFTNFGKPTVAVYDGNFDNRGELLLGHQYNGIMLDLPQAKAVLERVYQLWGRPVNLMTIAKEYDDHDVEVARRRNREPTPVETGKRIRYDGTRFETFDLDPDLEERIQATDVDYDTKPDDWLA
jgi:stage V sporulation protein R